MNTGSSYVVGIDGGGTKTTARLSSLHSAILAEATGGPSNFQIIGVEQAARTIVELVLLCCTNAPCSPAEVALVLGGLTGAGRAADQDRMTVALRAEAHRRRVSLKRFCVESDARIALEGAHGGAPGVIVIAGTGSIVFGKDSRGRVHRAGGWGRIIGDEGGGYTIGRLAIRAVTRDLDGREPTAMKRMAAKQFGLDSPESIVRSVYKENFDLASLVPMVLDAARRRDRAARAILRTQAMELCEDIANVAAHAKSGRASIPIAFIGGIGANENYFSRELRRCIKARIKKAVVVDPEFSPAHGAVLLALQHLKRFA